MELDLSVDNQHIEYENMREFLDIINGRERTESELEEESFLSILIDQESPEPETNQSTSQVQNNVQEENTDINVLEDSLLMSLFGDYLEEENLAGCEICYEDFKKPEQSEWSEDNSNICMQCIKSFLAHLIESG